MVVFASCHKYPEDPFISFKRPAQRLAGTWQITKYQVWGVDHSHDFDSLLNPNTLTNCSVNFVLYSDHGDGANGAWTFSPLFRQGGLFQFDYSNTSNPRFADLELGYSSDTVFYNQFFYRKKSARSIPFLIGQ